MRRIYFISDMGFTIPEMNTKVPVEFVAPDGPVAMGHAIH
jgi:hypothetical protein